MIAPCLPLLPLYLPWYTKENERQLMEKTYGVWGLGVVGKSVVRYLSNKGLKLSVMDIRKPTQEELSFLASRQIPYITQEERNSFFSSHDHIVVSPSMDQRMLKST